MGDHDGAFEEFMAGSAHRLHRVAFLLAGDLERAEEMTQHALVRTYVAWPRIRTADAYGYARRILINLHTDWWRRGLRRERPVPDVPDRPARGPDPGDALAARDAVTRALRRLSHRERAVVVCRYYLDLTEQQTADELGVALGTVKSTNARALRKLRIAPELSPAGDGSAKVKGVS